MNLDINIRFPDAAANGEVVAGLKVIANQLTALIGLVTAQGAAIQKGFAMADATLQEIADDVTAESTTEAGIATMVTQLVAQLAALPGVSAAAQTQMNAIRDAVVANAAGFAQALATGTAAVTPPPASAPPPVITAPATTGP